MKKKLPFSEGKIRKKTRKDDPPSIKHYFSIFYKKKSAQQKARRLKKYQRKTWKTKYFKNKKVFSKKNAP